MLTCPATSTLTSVFSHCVPSPLVGEGQGEGVAMSTYFSNRYSPSRIDSTEIVSRTSSLTIDRYLLIPKSDRFTVAVRSPPHT